jgi:hypothetical protein
MRLNVLELGVNFVAGSLGGGGNSFRFARRKVDAETGGE